MDGSRLKTQQVSVLTWLLFAPAQENNSCALAFADTQKRSDFTRQHEEPTVSQNRQQMQQLCAQERMLARC